MGAGAGGMPPGEIAGQLMRELDRERQEKNWLAQKYDEKCKEAQLLRQELCALRSNVCTSVASNGASASGRHVTRPGSPLKGMQTAVGQRFQGDVVQPNARNMPDVAPAKVAQAQQGKRELAASSVQGVDSYADEPMSALLRRRKEEWSLKSLPGVQNDQPAPLSRSQQPELVSIKTKTLSGICEKPLALEISKVAMSDLECPQSPKLKKKQRSETFSASKFVTQPAAGKFGAAIG
eukprot:TRINITY_DN74346_c0_g1_i1.p1 TRINITY_DN74346_c0_g1~~TRINITY_DN74346_c0_g1_i1.p1  ORF type:complete len:236 (-),score=44.04 TRINITY_DN74346_c0_g1_i1:101-808(-)